MQSTIRPTGPIERNLHVLVGADELSGEMEAQIKSVATKAVLPGFRKGNVPKNLIRERYGSGILAEIKVKKTEESLRDAIGKHNLRIAHISNLNYLSERDDPNLEYFVDLVTEPDLIIDNFEDLNIARPISDITEEDIDNQLKSLLDQKSEIDFVEGPVELDHVVEYRIRDLGSNVIRGVEGLPNVQDAPYTVRVADRDNFKDDEILTIIANEILGKSRDDKFIIDQEVNIIEGRDSVPESESEVAPAAESEDESGQDSQGKLHVEVHVESIQKRTHPELNEEFFKSLGRDVTNLEELRTSLKESLTESLSRRADSLVYQQIMKQLVVMNPVDIPLGTFQSTDESSPIEESESQEHRTQLLQNWIIQQYAQKNDIQVAPEDLNKALMVHHQVRSALGQSTDILYTEEFQRRTHAELLAEMVLKDIVPKLNIEEQPTSVTDFQQSKVDEELESRNPNGGPFTWSSPVSEDEIQQGKEEVDALRSRLEETEDTEVEEEVELASDEKEKKGGILKRIWNLVGGKK